MKRIDEKEILISVSEALADVPAGLRVFNSELKAPNKLGVQISQTSANVGQVLAAVQDAGLTITDISTNETDLEDIFLQLTSSKPEAAA